MGAPEKEVGGGGEERDMEALLGVPSLWLLLLSSVVGREIICYSLVRPSTVSSFFVQDTLSLPRSWTRASAHIVCIVRAEASASLCVFFAFRKSMLCGRDIPFLEWRSFPTLRCMELQLFRPRVYRTHPRRSSSDCSHSCFQFEAIFFSGS